ncbi:MAG: hypothetical protein R6X02_33625 [Enhygromyxa sp.]
MDANTLKQRFVASTGAQKLRKSKIDAPIVVESLERVPGRRPIPGNFVARCKVEEAEPFLTDPKAAERLTSVLMDCPNTTELFGAHARMTIRMRPSEWVVASIMAMSDSGGYGRSISTVFRLGLRRLDDGIGLVCLTPGTTEELGRILGITDDELAEAQPHEAQAYLE